MLKSLYLACGLAIVSLMGSPEALADAAGHAPAAHEEAHETAGHEHDDQADEGHVGHEAGTHGDGHHEGEHQHDDLPIFAERIAQIGPFPITNSMVMSWVVAIGLIAFFQAATRNIKLVPSGLQNFAEFIVESLYNFLLGIIGDEKLLRRSFWFFGGVFILILANNWAGLFPGIGTVGYYVKESQAAEAYGITDHFRPFFRGANADLNQTMAMSLIFAIMWFVWAISENGLKSFLAHIFAPKGDFKGVAFFLLAPIFFAVGLLEVVSIAIRPVALTFRLFGNIYGGEVTLEKLSTMLPEYINFLPALPFMFVELLVGFVQALVFMLLCAVFLRLICDHGDEHHAH